MLISLAHLPQPLRGACIIFKAVKAADRLRGLRHCVHGLDNSSTRLPIFDRAICPQQPEYFYSVSGELFFRQIMLL